MLISKQWGKGCYFPSYNTLELYYIGVGLDSELEPECPSNSLQIHGLGHNNTMTGLIFTMTEYYNADTHWEHVRCWVPESMLHPDLVTAWPAISTRGGVPVCRPDLNADNRDSYCFNNERHLTGRNKDSFDDLNHCLESLFTALVCYVPKYDSPATRDDYVDIEVHVGETSQCPSRSYQVLKYILFKLLTLFNLFQLGWVEMTLEEGLVIDDAGNLTDYATNMLYPLTGANSLLVRIFFFYSYVFF